MKLWGKLICAVTRKHKRGKRVPLTMAGGTQYTPGMLSGAHIGMNVYECPRCGATWTRKVKANAAPV